MQNQKGISTLVGIIIIVAVAIVAFGGVFAYQYFVMLKEKNQQQRLTVCMQEAKVCPDGSSVGRTGPNCEFAPCPSPNINDNKATCAGGTIIDMSKNEFCPPVTRTYNNAGEVIRVYQKDGKNYIDVDLIKFVLVLNGEKSIYGGDNESEDCSPVVDAYCIVNNDKTIKSYEVPENIEIINAYYPGNLISFEGLESWLVSSPYFRLQIENNIIQKMRQIYIP